MLTEIDFIQQITKNNDYYRLRQRILFSFRNEKNTSEITDILFYLINIERKASDYQVLFRYDYYFLQNTEQINSNCFVSDRVRNKCMKILKEKRLIDYTRKESLCGSLRIRINYEEIINLIVSEDELFREYHHDLSEKMLEKKEKRDKRILLYNETWEMINKLKFSSLKDFMKEKDDLNLHKYDVYLISIITKFVYLFTGEIFKWTAKDFNTIRWIISQSSRIRDGISKEEQDENLKIMIQQDFVRIIDSCHLDTQHTYCVYNNTTKYIETYRGNSEEKYSAYDIEFFNQVMSFLKIDMRNELNNEEFWIVYRNRFEKNQKMCS